MNGGTAASGSAPGRGAPPAVVVDKVWSRVRVPGRARFAESARVAVAFAAHEAVRLHHSYIGSEHLLLGALHANHRLHEALSRLIDLDRLLRRTLELSTTDPVPSPSAESAAAMDWGRFHDWLTQHPPLPLTPRGRLNLEAASRLSREAGAPGVGAGHVALAVLEDRRGAIGQALAEAPHDGAAIDNWTAREVEWGPLLELLKDGA